jgi:hypothetical protein
LSATLLAFGWHLLCDFAARALPMVLAPCVGIRVCAFVARALPVRACPLRWHPLFVSG